MAEDKKLVLIVDDEADYIKVLSLYFSNAGMEVVGVTSGKKALKAFDARLPDAVILDVNMPKMDGAEVCSTMRAKMGLKPIPIIALTGYHSAETKAKMMAFGADLYLTKPVEMKRLIQHVTKLIPNNR
jgi:CheY-like chemotaxis protein